jgi:hypothetical protein
VRFGGVVLLVPGTSVSVTQTAATRGVFSSIDRRELFLWLALLLLANDILFVAARAPGGPLEAFAHTLASKNIFHYLAWYAVFSLLLTGNGERAPDTLDIVLVLSVASLNLLPAHTGVWLSMTLAGLYVLVRHRDDNGLAAAAAVLLALAVNGYWGPRFLDYFAYYLLRADAALVGTVLSITQPGIEWKDTIIGWPGGHNLFIYSPCSSFHNISLGLLCWVSITKLVRTTWVWGDVVAALLVCAAVIGLNATRLYLMALNPGYFEYWHLGMGEQIVAWSTTAIVLVISLWGAVSGTRAR